MSEIHVRPLAVMAEAQWSFESVNPQWRAHSYSMTSTFDPFPAYAHDVGLVAAEAARVSALCPPLWDINLYVADREETGRSNGHSNVHEDGHYEGDDWVKDPPIGLIVLSGKRIPPHPAMTRHLVAHEYGHHVQWMLNQVGGARHLHDDHGHMTEYAELRGLPEDAVHHGTGGRWHDSVREVFACDFRILVCETEREFWPHPGIPRPEDVPGLVDWWADAVKRIEAAASAQS
ncbi:hypothetical protein [Microbispora sp. CA-102843]|uniref:hypothetical protein n=1 Tax=Microbispora sp. CA-102843 TaxID=3239952 RepID=UPI003D91F608